MSAADPSYAGPSLVRELVITARGFLRELLPTDLALTNGRAISRSGSIVSVTVKMKMTVRICNRKK